MKHLLLALVVLSLSSTSLLAESDSGGSNHYGKPEGLLGPVTFAPTVTILGFPTPFRFGLETKAFNVAGIGFDWGFFPALTFDNVKVKYNSWRITGRVFPFKGALFIGAGFGKQNLTGSTNVTISSVPVNISLDMNTTIITPHIGWRWTWASGFFFGMEYGVQIASSTTSTVTTDAPAIVQAQSQYTTEVNNITDEANKFGNKSLPHMAFAQFGYFF